MLEGTSSGDAETEEYRMGESSKGKDLGGVRTTPVRALEAGAFRMEVWIEEGRGKFQARVEEDDEDGYEEHEQPPRGR